MDKDIVVKFENVSKKYCKSLKRSMIYGMMDIGRNMIGLSSHSDRLRKHEFWAVNDVSFEMKRGEALGLIGPNGSGKTTLLKMINGIFWPDKGKITVKGKVGALIAVGAGFHPLLTGRENIYMNGAILGMSKREIDEKFDSIVDFADIGDFLDAPVKHYSSGMFVRLGFAVAIHCEPDILLVDEVLAVGDISFQAKCTAKLKELDKQGVTKIFVSHNLNSVLILCNKSIYLSNGKIQHYGQTIDVINEYKKDVMLKKNDSNRNDQIRYGTKDIEITKVSFLDKTYKPKSMFKRGEPFLIKMEYITRKLITNPEFVIGFYTEDGSLISKPNTRDHNISIDTAQGEGQITYFMESLPFNVGKYLVTVAVWDSLGQVAYDHHEKLYEFIVEDGLIDNKIHERFGYLYIPAQWVVNNALEHPKCTRD